MKKTLAKLLVFAMLEVGVLAGVPMNPEDIEKLMNVMNRTTVQHVIKKSDPNGDKDPPEIVAEVLDDPLTSQG